MGWIKEAEQMRDYGHTWGPGIDDVQEPTEEERAENEARWNSYTEKLNKVRVLPREEFRLAGALLKKDLPSGHDVIFGNAPYKWREKYSEDRIKLCKEAAKSLDMVLELRPKRTEEVKNNFFITVECVSFLPDSYGQLISFGVVNVESYKKCLQLVADFAAIGFESTVHYKDFHISSRDSAQIYLEMERWGVKLSTDTKEHFQQTDNLEKKISEAKTHEQIGSDTTRVGCKDKTNIER